jgi:hypothetical protein
LYKSSGGYANSTIADTVPLLLCIQSSNAIWTSSSSEHAAGGKHGASTQQKFSRPWYWSAMMIFFAEEA